MKKTIFYIILAMSLSLVFSQGKPCCKNKSGKGKVACKFNQANIDSKQEGIVSDDGTSTLTSEGVQCPHSAQGNSKNKSNCPNRANTPWWKFWGNKKGCCSTNS